MRRIALAAIVLMLALGTGVKWTAAQPAAQAGNDLLQWLPDGNIAVVVDVNRIMTSSLWAMLNERAEFKNTVDKINNQISEMGLRLSDIHSIAAMMSTTNMNHPSVAVSGAFNQNDVVTRLRANQKIKLTSEKYKNYDIYKVEDNPSFVAKKEPAKDVKPASKDEAAAPQSKGNNQDSSFAFYDAGTAVVGTASSVRAVIDAKVAGKPSAQNAKLASAISQNPAAAVRFAVEVTPAMTSSLQAGGMPIPDFSSVNLIFGSVDLASGIDVIATLRNDTVEHAKALSDRLTSLLEMVRGYLGSTSDPKMAGFVTALKTVAITNTEADVKITGNLPLEIITQILK
jgi:hypothetical protein